MFHLSRASLALVAALLPALVAADSHEGDFPTAPRDAQSAASAGLQRLDVPALKQMFIGTHTERDARGKTYRTEYGEDGSVILSNSNGLIDRGTFSITRQNGGGVCLRLEQQMNQRFCAIWFIAGDGKHLFGFNPRDGSLRAVSRREAP